MPFNVKDLGRQTVTHADGTTIVAWVTEFTCAKCDGAIGRCMVDAALLQLVDTKLDEFRAAEDVAFIRTAEAEHKC